MLSALVYLIFIAGITSLELLSWFAQWDCRTPGENMMTNKSASDFCSLVISTLT